MMQKFGLGKGTQKVGFWGPFQFSRGTPGGKEGKPPKAALRNAGFSYLKRLTPAGVGGFWDPLKS